MKPTALILGLLIVGLTLASGACAERPLEPGTAAITFVVHCYDVGNSALDGRPGVLSIQRGWRGASEVNRVIYDPQMVTVEQMVQWLKESGTYVRTLPEPPASRKLEEVQR